MKTKLAKLSLIMALACAPLGTFAEIPDWPTPDFLPKETDVFPVFVNPGATGDDTGRSWLNGATDLQGIGPITVVNSADVPQFVQIVMSTGVFGNQFSDSNAPAITIPSTITFNVTSPAAGQPATVNVPVVAVRGGYQVPDFVGCAEDESDLNLVRVDVRQGGPNSALSQAMLTGLSSQTAINNIDEMATIFDGLLVSTGAHTRSILEIDDGDFPFGLLIDNVVISRGKAELTTVQIDEAVYGGGIFISADPDEKVIQLHGVTFFNNSANARGGALYIEGLDGSVVSDVSVKVSYSTFLP